jgi:6-phosphogluconolactonase
MLPEIVGFPDAEAVARHAASEFVQRAKQAIWDRGVFRVALAGGSTPRRTYELLATKEFASRVEWTSVQIFFGDERAVAPDHPESNFHTAHEALLDTVPLHTSQIHRMAGERGDLAQSAREYEAELSRSFALKREQGFPSFDLVMLGMGKDGHTASLFPFTTALGEKSAWVVKNEVPQLGTDRLTLTAPVLNAARCVMFLVAGADKAVSLERVLEGPRNEIELPSQLISPAGDLLWLIDEAAAARLSRKPQDPTELKSHPA